MLFEHLKFKGGRILQGVMPHPSFNLILNRALSYRGGEKYIYIYIGGAYMLQDLWKQEK